VSEITASYLVSTFLIFKEHTLHTSSENNDTTVEMDLNKNQSHNEDGHFNNEKVVNFYQCFYIK